MSVFLPDEDVSTVEEDSGPPSVLVFVLLLEDVNSKVLDKEQVPLKKIMINKSIIADYMNWNPEEPRKKKEYRIATKKIIEDAIEKIKNVEYAAFFITYLAKNRNLFDTKDLFLNSLANFIEYAK